MLGRWDTIVLTRKIKKRKHKFESQAYRATPRITVKAAMASRILVVGSGRMGSLRAGLIKGNTRANVPSLFVRAR